MSDKPVAAGKTSYDLIDAARTFHLIGLKPGATVLDLACGAGYYSLEIARILGEQGEVHAVDLWKDGIEFLRKEQLRRGLPGIRPLVADIRQPLPIEADSIDICLLATILHDLSSSDQQATLSEASRLLRPGGTLAIIEFKKIAVGPGPPEKIRLSEQQLDNLLCQQGGFDKLVGAEVGEFNYLATYRNCT